MLHRVKKRKDKQEPHFKSKWLYVHQYCILLKKKKKTTVCECTCPALSESKSS